MQGRILFSRIMASGEFLHFVVGTDGSGETPFVPGKEFEARNLSPDGSLLAISALSEHDLFVGGTVGVDGTGYRLFPNADPSLHLVCGVWAPEATVGVRRMGRLRSFAGRHLHGPSVRRERCAAADATPGHPLRILAGRNGAGLHPHRSR